MVSNAYPEIMAEQAAERAQELVKPSEKVDNKNDKAPEDHAKVQIKAEVKK